jgi:hypothetical protein
MCRPTLGPSLHHCVRPGRPREPHTCASVLKAEARTCPPKARLLSPVWAFACLVRQRIAVRSWLARQEACAARRGQLPRPSNVAAVYPMEMLIRELRATASRALAASMCAVWAVRPHTCTHTPSLHPAMLVKGDTLPTPRVNPAVPLLPPTVVALRPRYDT